MTGFGLKNMDYDSINFLVRCFEAYYPESLGICLVHVCQLPCVITLLTYLESTVDLLGHLEDCIWIAGPGRSLKDSFHKR